MIYNTFYFGGWPLSQPLRPKSTILQYANCQQYGHTKAYCHRIPKCVKCAGNHQTANCPKKSRTSDVRCALSFEVKCIFLKYFIWLFHWKLP